MPLHSRGYETFSLKQEGLIHLYRVTQESISTWESSIVLVYFCNDLIFFF